MTFLKNNSPEDMQKPYHLISAAFCTIVVLSNMISAKIVPLAIFGFSIPAGLFTYPLTFLLSDLVTEIYGVKKAKQMVYITLLMSLLSFGIISMALILPADQPEMQNAFHAVLGLSGLRIFSSLISYLVAQVVDIQMYAWIKRYTSDRYLWLRNNGATCIAQLVDTILIDMIFLYWGLNWTMEQVVPIIIFSYSYKVIFSLLSTPLFYWCVLAVRKVGWRFEKQS